MQKSEYSILSLNKKNILSFAPYLYEERLEDIRRNDIGAYGLVKDNKTACGAIMYSTHPKEGTCFVESICVDESLRGQGLGSKLYRTLEQKMASQGIGEMRAKLFMPEEKKIDRFMESIGFDDYRVRECYCKLRADDIRKLSRNNSVAGIAKKLKQSEDFKALPLSKMDRHKRPVFLDIPFDPELSFAIDKHMYLLATSDDDGNIIIQRVSFDEDNPLFVFGILLVAFKKYLSVIGEDRTIYVTVISENGIQLIERLFAFAKEDIQFSYAMERVKTIVEDETFTMPYGAVVLPRINGISAMLSDFGEGYDHAVLTSEEEASISLFREGDKKPVYMYYDVEDAERAEGYTLHFSTGINMNSLSDAEKEKADLWMKESSLVSFKTDDKGYLFAESAIAEPSGLTEPKLVKLVLDSFLLEVDNLASLDRIAGEKGEADV